MKGYTQLTRARAGEITPEMRRVAEYEHLLPEFIRDGVAAGRIVIPANPGHANLAAVGIGTDLSTKINANIGNSPLSSCLSEEMEKLRVALKYGADAMMDLSTGGDLCEIRRAILAACPAPLGTVPVYEAVARCGEADALTPELILEVIAGQAAEGVDFMTVHAGLLRAHLPLADLRTLGIVSRGGSILATWMSKHQRENPFYERFDDILAICAKHDVTLSLGDGLRPGCLADASDPAQFGELAVLGELVRRCRAAGVQVMVEGPGHIPLDEIAMNMQREVELCDDAPFYILGPVVADCAPGYDHLTSAIGGAIGAWQGAAMLCYVTPAEHLGLPTVEDVRTGVVAFKIAAHAADVARKRPRARERDDAISRARAEFDWERQFSLALDPERAREIRTAALARREALVAAATSGDEAHTPYCTMCGPQFCSMRLHRERKHRDAAADGAE
jgi:phosphomethylpyrimidine synthase